MSLKANPARQSSSVKGSPEVLTSNLWKKNIKDLWNNYSDSEKIIM